MHACPGLRSPSLRISVSKLRHGCVRVGALSLLFVGQFLLFRLRFAWHRNQVAPCSRLRHARATAITWLPYFAAQLFQPSCRGVRVRPPLLVAGHCFRVEREGAQTVLSPPPPLGIPCQPIFVVGVACAHVLAGHAMSLVPSHPSILVGISLAAHWNLRSHHYPA